MTARSKAALYSDRTERWGLVEGDTLALLPQLPAASMDVVVTDPPYNLTVHGEDWDRHGTPAAFAAWTQQWAAECLRIVKPGGYVIAFGAPRTFHRLVAGIEDAGLEIRDLLVWLYPPGIPKSRRIPGGLGSALKPAHEPIVMARVPSIGKLTENHAAHGTGLLDIHAGAVRVPGEADRWPSNVVLSHAKECSDMCAPDCPTALLDAQRPGSRPSRFLCLRQGIDEGAGGGL